MGSQVAAVRPSRRFPSLFGEQRELRRGPGAVEPFQNNETSQYSRFHRAPIVMRTACLVIVTLLFSTAMRGYPQDRH